MTKKQIDLYIRLNAQQACGQHIKGLHVNIWILDQGICLSSAWSKQHTYTSSCASAAGAGSAISTVSKMTPFSYGSMRFSGACLTQTHQRINMKFFHDYVGEITRCAKMAGIMSHRYIYSIAIYISMAGADPQLGEIHQKLFLPVLYFSCMHLQPKRLNRFTRKIWLERRGLL
jgi:hypothetical protein